jgi:MFS family permease
VKLKSEIFYLYAARAARGFGDGFAVIILPAYLTTIGFAPFRIGLVAAAALFGSAVMTLAVGYLARRYDLRSLLLFSAVAMVVTGIVFPFSPHILFVIAIAFLGTMNPSTGDIGMFVPLEHSMLAHGAADDLRTHVFARYSLIGALATAAGALAAAAPDGMVRLGLASVLSLQVMFYIYAALGLVAAR